MDETNIIPLNSLCSQNLQYNFAIEDENNRILMRRYQCFQNMDTGLKRNHRKGIK
jgi:hypothetical protein